MKQFPHWIIIFPLPACQDGGGYPPHPFPLPTVFLPCTPLGVRVNRSPWHFNLHNNARGMTRLQAGVGYTGEEGVVFGGVGGVC